MRLKEFLYEYKHDITKQKIGSNLEQAAQRDRNQDAETILSTLEKIDPTPNKQYTLWLANQYIKGLFRLEDKNRVKDVLEKFISIKSRLPEKDIGRYTLHTLEDTLDKIFNVQLQQPDQEQTKQTTSTEPTEQQFPVPPDTEVLYNGPFGLLAIPKTFAASCALGSGTKWCTTGQGGKGMFGYYNRLSPLYIWRDKNGEKYQFHFSGDMQFMDSKDREIKPKLLRYFVFEHPVLKEFFASKIPFIKKYPEKSYQFALQLGKRIPELEPTIARNTYYGVNYAIDVLGRRWKEAEPQFLKNKYFNQQLYRYWDHFFDGPWPEFRKKLMTDEYDTYWDWGGRIITDYISQVRKKLKDRREKEKDKTKKNSKKLKESFLLEYNRQKTINNYGKEIKLRSKKYLPAEDSKLIFSLYEKLVGSDFQRQMKPASISFEDFFTNFILDQLEKSDPTPNKIYTPWLAREYGNGNIVRLEDLAQAKYDLQEYNLLKKQSHFINYFKRSSTGKLNPELVKNIFNISAHELSWMIRAYQPEEILTDKGSSNIVFEDDTVKVIQPLDEKAACYYGQGTRWCTASTKSENRFEYYNELGPLYILLPKKPEYKGEKYQLHIETDQFMDENDQPVSPDILSSRFSGFKNWLESR